MFTLIITAVLIFLGLLGAFLPLLPGPPLAFVGLLVYGLVSHFTKVTGLAIAIFGILTCLTLILDIFGPLLFARSQRASRTGSIGAFLGTILGMFFFPPFGLLFGPFVGALFGEYLHHPDSYKAWRTAWASFLGFIFSTLLRLVVTLAMAGYFVYALFK